MSKLRQATEQDFRRPEFLNCNPEDFEIREDGKCVRKDRWETAIHSISYIVTNSVHDFEISDVVDLVQKMARRLERLPDSDQQWFLIKNRKTGMFLLNDWNDFTNDVNEACIFKDLEDAQEAFNYLNDKFSSIVNFKPVVTVDTDNYVVESNEGGQTL